MNEKIFIRHRVNTLAELRGLNPAYGAEIDLRSDIHAPGRIVLAHDPWKASAAENFEKWLGEFVSKEITGPLILNTKEDGLEERAIELLGKYGVRNYFFLDTAFPTLVRHSLKLRNRCFAARVSKYEPVEFVLSFDGYIEWAWVDCFDGHPLDVGELAPLKGKFRLCLVSPELQNQPLETISKFKDLAGTCEAICTKSPDSWKQFLGAGVTSELTD